MRSYHNTEFLDLRARGIWGLDRRWDMLGLFIWVMPTPSGFLPAPKGNGVDGARCRPSSLGGGHGYRASFQGKSG